MNPTQSRLAVNTEKYSILESRWNESEHNFKKWTHSLQPVTSNYSCYTQVVHIIRGQLGQEKMPCKLNPPLSVEFPPTRNGLKKTRLLCTVICTNELSASSRIRYCEQMVYGSDTGRKNVVHRLWSWSARNVYIYLINIWIPIHKEIRH